MNKISFYGTILDMKPISREKIVKLIRGKEWFVQGFNGLPLYLHAVAAETGWVIVSELGVNYSHFFLRLHSGRALWYYDVSDLKNIGEAFFRKVNSEKKYLQIIGRYEKNRVNF